MAEDDSSDWEPAEDEVIGLCDELRQASEAAGLPAEIFEAREDPWTGGVADRQVVLGGFWRFNERSGRRSA